MGAAVSKSVKKEEIRIVCPVGATGWSWDMALRCARRFATEGADRPAGVSGAAVYVVDSGWSCFVYWTKARRLVAHVQEATVSETEADELRRLVEEGKRLGNQVAKTMRATAGPRRDRT